MAPTSGGAAYHVAACNNTDSVWYCCDGDKSGACCNDPKNTLGLGDATIAIIARPPKHSGTSTQTGNSMSTSETSNTATSSATSSTTQILQTTLLSPTGTNTTAGTSSPPASSSAPSPSSSTAGPVAKVPQHSNHTVILGSSISLSVAAVLLGFGLFACFWIRRGPRQESQQRQRQQRHQDPEKQINRTAEGIRDSAAAATSDEGDSTLINSHGQTSTPSLNPNNATRDAVELSSSTIRHSASTSSPRWASSPICEADNYSHPSLAPFPLTIPVRDPPPQSYPTHLISPLSPPGTSRSAYRPAELESAFDIAPIHSRFRTPSPSPTTIELEARDGVTISTLYNVASGSPRNPHGFRPTPPTRGSPLSTILQSPYSSNFPREEDSETGSRVELPVTRTRNPSRVFEELDGTGDEQGPPTPAKRTEDWVLQEQVGTAMGSSHVQGQMEGRRCSGEMDERNRHREGDRRGYRALNAEREPTPDSPSSMLEGEARNWANWF